MRGKKIITHIVVILFVITSVLCINIKIVKATSADIENMEITKSVLLADGKKPVATEKGDADGGSDITNPITNPDAYKPGEVSGTKTANIGKSILAIVQAFGVIVAVAGCIFIGIKYMLGSVEEKAEYKKTMVPYIIGLVLLFGTTTVVNLIYSIVTGIK